MTTFEKCDAHLAAALHSNFLGYEYSQDEVNLLIEVNTNLIEQVITKFEALCTQYGATWVKAHVLEKSRYFSATGSVKWMEALQKQNWVVRLALANQLKPLRAAPNKPEHIRTAKNDDVKSESAVLLGVIDHGCPFANQQFLDDRRSTRVLAIWDQDRTSEFKPDLSFVPPEFGYGAQVNRAQLNALFTSRHALDDETEAYAELEYNSLRHSLTHGAHTLSLFTGAKVSRSVLARGYKVEPELHHPRLNKPSSESDIVFVQLPRRALLSPSSTGMSRCILDGVRFILRQAGEKTMRVVICIPYGSLLGPHDGSSVIEKALDEIVDSSRRNGRDVKLVFASGNSANKPVYARTLPVTSPRARPSQLHWSVPPHLQANTSLDMWIKYSDSEIELKLTEPGASSFSIKLSDKLSNTTKTIKHGKLTLGVCAVINDEANKQFNILLQVQPSQVEGSLPMSGRWLIELITEPTNNLDAHFYLGWGGRNNGFSQRIFPTRLIPGSNDVEIVAGGSILGSACGQETYVVGACSNAPNYHRMPYSGGGKPRGGIKAHASCLSVSEESNALAGLACGGVRYGFNARVNGTSVAAPMAARVLADSGWLVASAKPIRQNDNDRVLQRQVAADTSETAIEIRQYIA